MRENCLSVRFRDRADVKAEVLKPAQASMLETHVIVAERVHVAPMLGKLEVRGTEVSPWTRRMWRAITSKSCKAWKMSA